MDGQSTFSFNGLVRFQMIYLSSHEHYHDVIVANYTKKRYVYTARNCVLSHKSRIALLPQYSCMILSDVYGPFVDHIWRATRSPFYSGWPCWEQLPTGQWQRSYRSNHNPLPISLLIKGLDRTLNKRLSFPHPQLFLSVELRNGLPHAKFCQSYPD